MAYQVGKLAYRIATALFLFTIYTAIAHPESNSVFTRDVIVWICFLMMTLSTFPDKGK